AFATARSKDSALRSTRTANLLVTLITFGCACFRFVGASAFTTLAVTRDASECERGPQAKATAPIQSSGMSRLRAFIRKDRWGLGGRGGGGRDVHPAFRRKPKLSTRRRISNSKRHREVVI